jgi:hypothetical protein
MLEFHDLIMPIIESQSHAFIIANQHSPTIVEAPESPKSHAPSKPHVTGPSRSRIQI